MDAHTAADIDARISALSTEVVDAEARLATLRHNIVQLTAHRNACMPYILRLPNEILVHIASLYAFDSIDEYAITRIQTLVSICHTLRTLLIRTPELWTFIDGLWSVAVAELYAESAGARSIRLHLCNYHATTVDLLQYFNRFLRLFRYKEGVV
jgi:hypothetical protein